MKFRILGSGSAVASLERSQSCLWLEEERLLLDCGEGSAAKLNHLNLLPKISAVAISHFHPDHVVGLYTLLQNMYILKRKEALTIYLPESIEEFKNSLNMFYLDLDKFKFKCHFKRVDEMANDLEIISIPTMHMEKYTNFANERKSYAFYLPLSGFLYSSDVNNLKFLKQVDNIDLIVLDGLHPEAEEIIQLRQDSKLRIILTHGLSQKLEKKISKMNRFEIADENKEYSL